MGNRLPFFILRSGISAVVSTDYTGLSPVFQSAGKEKARLCRNVI
jgi:hypothetical protein